MHLYGLGMTAFYLICNGLKYGEKRRLLEYLREIRSFNKCSQLRIQGNAAMEWY